MKTIFILLIVLSSCSAQYTCPTYTKSKPLIYSEYESEGGFNYLEDAAEVFDSLDIKY